MLLFLHFAALCIFCAAHKHYHSPFESIVLDWQKTRAEIKTMSTTELLVLVVCKMKLFVSLSNNLKGTSSLVPLQIIKKIFFLHFFAFSEKK